MTPIPTELRELLERIVAGDVGRMIYAKLATGQATETDDGKAWLELRALLATPPADAADMGGQAGQEVTQQITIVQHLDAKGSRKALGAMNARLRCKVGHLERKIAEQCEELEILNKQLDRFRSQSHGIPALAEHERLSEELAQHRQQAGKLVEALRKLTAAMACHDSTPEEYNALAGAREALADWEKTSCGK